MTGALSRAEALTLADGLLARMTLAEKVQQMVGVMSSHVLGAGGPSEAAMQQHIGHGIGHIAGMPALGYESPQGIARNANRIQKYLLEQTRLGIPAIIHSEGLNGAMLPQHPVFPTAIGLAATWDPSGVQEMAALISDQLRAVGIRQALSPVMDVARDARWGRVHETYGEDPYLASVLSVAYTRGMQGDDLRSAVIATAKHFVGYGAGEAGQNTATTRVSERELYEVYARPFEAAICEAGLGSVMNSYSDYDGIPIVASARVLRDLLRGDLGFEGTVVADYAAVKNLVDIQKVARDAAEAGILAVTGGLDVELPAPYGYSTDFLAAAERGDVDVTLIDEAARRVLADKYQLGLFENPYVDEKALTLSETKTASNDLAQRLANESLTLLKNDGDLLPLSRTAKRIAIVGPHGDDVDFAFPGYTYPSSVNMMRAMMGGESTNMAGIEAAGDVLGAAAVGALAEQFGPLLAMNSEEFVRTEYGSISLADAVRNLVPDTEVEVVSTGVLDSEPTDLEAVAAAAARADIVILALGGRPGWFGDQLTEGEGADTAEVSLPSCQHAVVAAVAATGVPAAALISTGRPFAIPEVAERIPAILWAYYGGQRASEAVAAALFGDVNPGGKLPYSIPRHSGQAPVYYGQHRGTGYRRPEGNSNLDYLDVPATPLFPFGHGLSYTTFEYEDLVVEGPLATDADTMNVSLAVANSGPVAGDEVVQLYVSAHATGLSRPAQQLVGFKRVGLASGGSAEVRFVVPIALLGYLDVNRRFIVEPGTVGVIIGSSSGDIRLNCEINVTGERREITRDERRFISAATLTATAAR